MQHKLNPAAIAPYVGIFLICILALWQVASLYSGLHWDMLDVHLPWLTFMSEVLQMGELHYWNPYQELGYPFHADMLSTWYPPALITARFIGFDLIILHYYYLFHVLVAGIGMHKLSGFFQSDKRIAFIAAICYMLCGVSVSNAQHLFIITSLAWLPFVMYYFLKLSNCQFIADALKLSLAMCFMITGGYPFLSVVTIYLLIILFCFDIFYKYKISKQNALNTIYYITGSGLVALLLCAPMLIAFTQVVPVLERGAGLSVETALSNPYTFNAFLFSLVPFAVANNWEYFGSDISMVNIYGGILIAVFMVYGLFKKARQLEYFFLGFGIFCLLGSFSQELPLMKWMVVCVPLFNFFRFPALLRLFFILGAIIFASRGISNFMNDFEKDKKTLARITAAFALWIVVLIMYGLAHIDFENITFLQHHDTFQMKLMALTVFERLSMGGLVQLLILVLFIIVLLNSKTTKVFFRSAMLLFIIDMFLAVQLNINYTIVDPVVHPIEVATNLKAITPADWPIPTRTSMVNAKNEGTGVVGIWRNVNNFTKQPAIDGFSSFWLNDYLLLEKDTLLSKHALDNSIAYLSASIFPLNRLAEHKISNEIEKENLYFSTEDFSLLKNKNIAHATSDTAYFLEFKPNTFKIKAMSAAPQVLTIMQSAYPGWNVLVNGEKTTWYKSNYLSMSVFIPAGESVTEFKYENPPVLYAFYIALGVFIFTAGAVLYFAFIRKREAT